MNNVIPFLYALLLRNQLGVTNFKLTDEELALDFLTGAKFHWSAKEFIVKKLIISSKLLIELTGHNTPPDQIIIEGNTFE